MTRYQNLMIEIAECKPRTILEIGTWNGVHAVEMIEMAAVNHPKDDLVYYGFDLWEQLTLEEKASEYCGKKIASQEEANNRLRRTGIEFHLVQGNTKETLPKFAPEFPVDFVVIDGGHSLDTIASDWHNVERMIHRDSVILFDDYYKDDETVGAFKTIQNIIDSNRYDVRLLKPIDYIPDIKRTIQFVKVSFPLL